MQREKTADNTVFYDGSFDPAVICVLDQCIKMCGFICVSDKKDARYAIQPIDKNEEPCEGYFVSEIGSDDEHHHAHCFAVPIRAGQLIDMLHILKNGLSKSYPEKINIQHFIFYVRASYLHDPKGDTVVRLTEKERDLLYYLATHTAEYVSRDELLEKIWGYNTGIETHTVETHFYRLRQKIENDASTPQILLTRENGYTVKL